MLFLWLGKKSTSYEIEKDKNMLLNNEKIDLLDKNKNLLL